MTNTAHDDIAQAAAVVRQFDNGLVNLRVLVFAFGMRDVDLLPGANESRPSVRFLPLQAQANDLTLSALNSERLA